MNSSALIANGQIDHPETLRSNILQHKRIVAVDGGLRICRQLEIIPHLMVGDFDSASLSDLELFKEIPRITLEKEKDVTDLEAAIEYEVKQSANQITLFGALGKRFDHSITNLLLAGRYPGLVKIESEEEILFAIVRETHFATFKGQTISLLPIYGPARRIETKGLKWELNHRSLDLNFIGISNICLKETVSILIEEGMLLCSLLKRK